MQPPKMANSPAPRVAKAISMPAQYHEAVTYLPLLLGVALVIFVIACWAYRLSQRKEK